jgi:hypothetical protein
MGVHAVFPENVSLAVPPGPSLPPDELRSLVDVVEAGVRKMAGP